MARDAYIIAAARTSVTTRSGELRDCNFDVLGAAAITGCLDRAGLRPDDVDDIILSNALGAGGNPARVTALAAGLPRTVAGLTIDRQCAGGLDAVGVAAAMIGAGQADVLLAGGAESTSLRPERRFRDAWGSEPELRNQARFAPDANHDPDMAEAAARLADRLGLSQQDQDAWAIASHAKALDAADRVADEIANPPGVVLTGDPFARALTPEVCARAPKLAGTITAANAAVAADGAAMLAVVARPTLDRLSPTHALRIVATATVGGDPAMPGLAPVAAIGKVLQATGMTSRDFAAVEIMEAYACQAMACVDAAGLDSTRINRGGGGLARGHPTGASGAVLAVRLFHELRATGGRGLAAIAAAGGIGTAMVVETVET